MEIRPKAAVLGYLQVLQALVQVSTSTQICAVMILNIGAGIGAVLGTQPLDAELLNPGNRAKS
jgi:hypothetical protein